MLRARVGRAPLLALATVVGSLGLVACDLLGPKDPGVIKVNYSTKPGDEALFNWTVSVDGGNPQSVRSDTTGWLLIEGVSPGERRVQLGSLPALCTAGSNERLVLVPSKDTARVAFAVRCARLTGDVMLLVTTAGADMDPDGYTVNVDGVAGPGVAASTTGATVKLARLAPGPHEITLGGLAENCSVPPSAPRSASVVADAAVSLSIGVLCKGNGITDPVGDTLLNTARNPAAAFDIVAVNARYSPLAITVALRFRSPIESRTLIGYVDFDLDENPLTGEPPFMNNFGGSAPQGVEASLFFSASTTPSVTLIVGSTFASNVEMIAAGDSVRFVVPLSMLNDDGNLTITTIVGTPDRPTDFAPNALVFVSRRPSAAAAMEQASPFSRPAALRPHRSASPDAPEPDRPAAPPRRAWWQRPPA
jgi:hypothetical protein